MARPPKKPQDCHSKKITVRFRPEELERLQDRADARGVTLSAYLRDAALRRPLPPIVPTVNREAAKQLAKIGINLNQLARRANIGHVPEREFETLHELLSTLRELRFLLKGKT